MLKLEDISKIYFMRSGGYAGFNLNTIINLNELNPEEASELKRIITKSGLHNLTNTSSKPGADLFSYTITFESPEESQTIIIDQKDISSKSENLITFLTNIAKSKR